MLILVALLALVPSTWHVQLATQDVVPFQIINVRLNDQGRVEFDVVSSAQMPATAWQVEARVIQGDGSLRPRSSVGQDHYIIEAQRGVVPDAQVDARFLRPGVPYHMAFGKFETLPVLVAKAMILADGSTFGDPATIDHIFTRRRLERDARERILTELRAVQKSRRGIDALNEARRRIIPSSEDAPDATVWKGVGQNIDLALRQSERALRQGNDKIDPDAHLGHIIDLVEREYRAARQHSVKK